MKKIIIFAFFVFMFSDLSFASNDEIKANKSAEFVHESIEKVLEVVRSSDASYRYGETLNLVEELFDYENVPRFALTYKNYKNLSDEQKDYLSKYSKRSVALMLLDKFFVKNMEYTISKAAKHNKDFEIYLSIRKVEGIDLKQVLGDVNENGNDGNIEVIFIVNEKEGKFILKDIKAMNLSFLIKARDFYQKKLKENNMDYDELVDDLIMSLERDEKDFRQKYKVSEDLFPSIKTLLILE
ncbi:MAG: Toluene tolerance, Ttg2 [Alphaproteobacteria bacterium ADurb.Bin438]|nr:MAG: Toluene tolerance, Ttg2 [Alphaproteobacteria bacterium ADurb.Bin438]